MNNNEAQAGQTVPLDSTGSMIDLKKLRLSQIFRSKSMSIFDRLDREHEVIDEKTFIDIVYPLLESNDQNEGLDAPERKL